MRVNRALLGAALLFATSVSPIARAQVVETPTFSGEAAKAQVDVLAGSIGERPAFSQNYDEAALYASQQLLQWGYQPTLQSFQVLSYDDRGSTIDITSTVGQAPRIEPDTLTYSIAGQVEAPLVAVSGLGRPDEMAAADVAGKIALVQRGELRFAEKVDNAAAAGAVGVIIYNNAGDRIRGSLARSSTVPAVGITAADGRRLLDLLAAGPVQARLGVDASIGERPATNVVAELPGGRPDAGAIVIGGHLDGVPGSPGANDNASGSAVVLELARTLAQRDASQRPYTLRFVLFGAEELGLFGSRHYVGTLDEAERRGIRAMINLDMVGVGDAWRFGGTEDLVQRALAASTEMGERTAAMGGLSGASDHASFISAGVPALFIHRTDDPNYHGAGDRPGLVDAEALTQAGTIALRVMDSLAAQ